MAALYDSRNNSQVAINGDPTRISHGTCFITINGNDARPRRVRIYAHLFLQRCCANCRGCSEIPRFITRSSTSASSSARRADPLRRGRGKSTAKSSPI